MEGQVNGQVAEEVNLEDLNRLYVNVPVNEVLDMLSGQAQVNVNPQQSLIDEFFQRHQLHASRRRQVIGRIGTVSILFGAFIGAISCLKDNSITESVSLGILSSVFCFGISCCCALGCDCGEISMFDNDIIDMISSSNLNNLQNDAPLIHENEPLMP